MKDRQSSSENMTFFETVVSIVSFFMALIHIKYAETKTWRTLHHPVVVNDMLTRKMSHVGHNVNTSSSTSASASASQSVSVSASMHIIPAIITTTDSAAVIQIQLNQSKQSRKDCSDEVDDNWIGRKYY